MADRHPAPVLRASDSEREATIDRLRDAAADGRLTLEELSDRIEAAAQAVSRQDLLRLEDDLPRPASSLPAAAPIRVSTIFGDTRRAGVWAVPAHGRWESVFGDVVLDLREASMRSLDANIHARTIFGDVELLVPDGVAVQVRARTLFGDVAQEAGTAAGPDAPRVLLTGGTLFGDVTVWTPEPKPRWTSRMRARLRRGDPPRR